MERCDDNSDTAAANLLGTVVEYYGVSSHSIEWRTDSKPGSKSSIPVSPFDLSDGLRRNNALWKEDAFVTELGVADDKIDIVRDTSVPMGLKNMGATCYVNSFIQALFMNQEFTSLMLALDVPDTSPQLRAFQSLLAEMKYGVSKFADPTEFVDALSIGHNLQEDCSEFSTLFLNWLEQTLQGHPSDAAKEIRSFFEGEFETTLNCSLCGNERKLRESFMELRLELPDSGPSELEDLVHAAMHHEETIDGYFCSACSQHTVLVKKTAVVKTPPYLQLAINRYRFSAVDGVRRKVGSPVKIPLSKPIPILGYDFTCTGYLEHISSTATSGHYIAHLRQDGTWWTYDDLHVSKRVSADVLKKSSASAYMVFLSRRFGSSELKLYPTVTRALREVDLRNEAIVARKQLLVAQQEAVKRQVTERRKKIQEFSLPEFPLLSPPEIAAELHVIDRDFFTSWCRGEDILGRPDFLEKNPFLKNLCGHTRHSFAPSLVFRNEVKFVPRNVIEAMDLPYLPTLRDSVCSECVTSLESLLSLSMEYFALFEPLKTVRMNFWQQCWECGEVEAAEYRFSDEAVWINTGEIPRLHNKALFGSKLAVFKKFTKSAGGSDTSTCDLSSGAVCPHGRVVPEVLTDATFALKPKKLIDKLVEFAQKIFPPMGGLLPWVTVSQQALYDPSGNVSPCEACAEEQQSLSEERSEIFERLANIVSTPPPVRFEPGVSYYVLPGVWITKIKSFLHKLNRYSRTGLPELKLSGTLICPHGDLLVDPTDIEKTNEKVFLVSEVDAAFIVDLDFKNKPPEGLVLPVVQRDPVNFTLGSAPPVCASCSVLTSTPKIALRVLPEIENCFETNLPTKRSPPSYKSSRSKLVGVTQGSIDQTSLGIDVKTHLIELGILEHSLYDIEPDDAIERIKIFLPNPTVRGALIEVHSGACLGDLVGEDAALDTIYVEFTQNPQEEPAHIRHKVRKITKKPESEDAGFKGSLLRGDR